jgi:hypothetical protein
MKLKKHNLSNILIFFLSFTIIISPIIADFQIGDSCLPVDEEGFIEYDFDKYSAPEPLKLKIKFVDLSKIYEPVEAMGANITVNEYNSTTNKYQVSIIDSKKYQDQPCLCYNKTVQYFRYNQSMNKLLINGYGGYYVIPNDPVDLNIVKIFVETYTNWSANIVNNVITIDIANDQYILTYNEQGILIKEEVKNNNVVISVLTFISYKTDQNGDIGDFDIVIIISIIILIVIASVIIKKSSIKNHEYI